MGIPDNQFGTVGALLYRSRKKRTPSSLKREFKNFLQPFERPQYFYELESFENFHSNTKPQRKQMKQYFIDKINIYSKFKKESDFLFLHGFMGSSLDFKKIKYYFKNLTLNSVDLPYHGENKSVPSSYKEVIKDLHLFFQTLENPPSVIGYSQGGRILLGLLDYDKDILKKCFVISTHPGIKDKNIITERKNPFLDDIFSQEDFKQFIKNWYSQDIYEGLLSVCSVDELLENKIYSSIPSWKKAYEVYSTVCQPNFSKRLNKWNKQLFYICGNKDKKYKVISKEFSNCGVEVCNVSDASHAVHLMKPKVVSDFILSKV